MGSRRKGREYALQALYMVDVAGLDHNKSLRGIIRGEKADAKTIEFAKNLFEGAQAKVSELDKVIVQYSENWEMKRMAAIDRNLLRLGTYELLYEVETPVSVIIDEAVEIAKVYSTNDSGKFVNGILDKIKAERKSAKKNGKKGHSKS